MREMDSKEKWIIERGNGLFFVVMAFFLIITTILCIKFQHMDMDGCYRGLITLNVISLLIMTPYRILLVFDREYMDFVYPNVKKAYLFELPFFPCNTAEILFLFAILFKSRVLLSYCFFLGLIGPILAFLVPAKGFEREYLFKMRMIGFYTTHCMCLMNIPLLLSGGFFIPKYSDIPGALFVYLLISFAMYFFNRYLDSLELGCPGNYFFNMDPDFHPVFRAVYNVIPYRFLFTIPIVGLFGFILAAIVFIISIIV